MIDVDIVRDGDGTIRVAGTLGTGTPGTGGPGFTRAVLDVAGGLLTWPHVGDLGLPAAEIDDVRDAQQWLWAIYGERASIACATVDPDGVRVPVAETTLARDAARLAFGHWAARWWPASYVDDIPALDADLLGAELAALTYQCQQLFDPSSDNLTELIEEHQAGLDRLIHWYGVASAPTARSIDTVLRLIDAAADTVGLDTPPLRRLRSAIDQPAELPTRLSAGFARRHEHTLAAGDPLVSTGRVIASGSGVNDWSRYPPGLVDAAEDAVSWVARAVGARRQIEINAIAGDAPATPAARLVAEVRVDSGAASRVPLVRRGDVWAGVADLVVPPTGQALIEVDVLLPGFDRTGGGDPEGDGLGSGGRADRDAIRTLARRRLAAAAHADSHGWSDSYDWAARPFLAEIAAGQDM